MSTHVRTCTRRTLAFAPAVVVALSSLSCGSGKTPGTPSAAPTPSPSTGTTATVSGPSCALGKGDPGAACAKGSAPQLLTLVETAIDLLVREKPQLFDLKDVAVQGTELYRVLDQEGYLDGVVANLLRQGACAERDGGDYLYQHVVVKTTNDYSETYDVLLSSGYIRRGPGALLNTCTPANFPIDRAAIDAPPAGSGCGRPYPPPVTRFSCKVHLPGIEYVTLDSTPLVGPDVGYCAALGYTDGRSICPVRPEGAPDRVACELWRVGKARDTGRPGPTWTRSDGSFCTGKESGCQNQPDNQFQLWVYASGSYTVTADNGASCVVKVDR